MATYRSHVVLTRDEFLLFKSALHLERAHGSYWRWRYSELRQKYDPNQPRIPGGQPGGGRWTDGDGPEGGNSRGRDEGASATSARTTTLPDGTRVRSEFDAARSDGAWDARHTVTSPDGVTTVFETIGRDQVVRDGASGQVLARTTWTPDGPVEQPVADQVARGRLARGVFDAATRLYNALSAQPHSGIAVLDIRAREYAGDDAEGVAWVGTLATDEVRAICDREGRIQRTVDDAYQQAVREVGRDNPAALGSRAHMLVAQEINRSGRQNLRAEVSWVDARGGNTRYGEQGSIRADILENIGDGTVCMPDIKTGRRSLSARRMDSLALLARRYFPETRRILVYEMRPASE
jgi:hypothetical protein